MLTTESKLDVAKNLFSALRREDLDICGGHIVARHSKEDIKLGIFPTADLRYQYQHFGYEVWLSDDGRWKKLGITTRLVLLCEDCYPVDPRAVPERYDPDRAIFSEVEKDDDKLVAVNGRINVSRTPIIRRIVSSYLSRFGIPETFVSGLFSTTFANPEAVTEEYDPYDLSKYYTKFFNFSSKVKRGSFSFLDKYK